MTKSKVCLLLNGLLCVLLSALLAASAVGVYRDGMARREKDPLESIYTPEIVSEKLVRAGPLFVVSLGLASVCLALGIRDEGAEKPVRDPEIVRDLACARVSRPTKEMTGERRKQRRLMRAGWGTFVLCMVPPAVYLASPGHFPERDLEGMFYGLMSVLLPFAALGLCALARRMHCGTEAWSGKRRPPGNRRSRKGPKGAPGRRDGGVRRSDRIFCAWLSSPRLFL